MPMTLIHMGNAVNINCDCSIIGSYECQDIDNSCYLSGNYLKGKDKPNYPVPAVRIEVAIDHKGCTVYVDSFAMCGDMTLWYIVADSRVNHPKTRETI